MAFIVGGLADAPLFRNTVCNPIHLSPKINRYPHFNYTGSDLSDIMVASFIRDAIHTIIAIVPGQPRGGVWPAWLAYGEP
jgi:hypothetical protein